MKKKPTVKRKKKTFSIKPSGAGIVIREIQAKQPELVHAYVLGMLETWGEDEN